MYDRILHPTDGSEGSDPAVEHAIELAGRYDATLHVLSVLESATQQATGDVAGTEVRERRRATLESIARRARDTGVSVETAIREGSPDREILEYVDAEAVDMIVMGTHGRTGIGRVLLGSVAEQVVRASPVPVLTVRVDAEGRDITNAPAAERRAREALRSAGHEDVEIPEDPHRTTTAWVVPATTAEGTFNVHIDAAQGTTRIARLDR